MVVPVLCSLLAGLGMIIVGVGTAPADAQGRDSRPEAAAPLLFGDAGGAAALPLPPLALRARAVTVHLDVLLDGAGRPRGIREVTLNLFPDATYAGVVERIESAGDTHSWVGHVRDAPPGEMTMVYTGGVFLGSFAAPEGIYEASHMGGETYRIVLIDRARLPGGDERKEPGALGQ